MSKANLYPLFASTALCKGVAFELKRQKGGRLTDGQALWLSKMESNGWITFVAYGAHDAIDKIERVYGKWTLNRL